MKKVFVLFTFVVFGIVVGVYIFVLHKPYKEVNIIISYPKKNIQHAFEFYVFDKGLRFNKVHHEGNRYFALFDNHDGSSVSFALQYTPSMVVSQTMLEGKSLKQSTQKTCQTTIGNKSIMINFDIEIDCKSMTVFFKNIQLYRSNIIELSLFCNKHGCYDDKDIFGFLYF